MLFFRVDSRGIKKTPPPGSETWGETIYLSLEVARNRKPIDTLPTRHFESLPMKVETNTETETDKIGLKPIGIGHCICLGQYEHLPTIPYIYNPFFNGPGLCRCEHTLTIVLFTLHGNGNGTATSSIGNNWSWSLSLAQTSVNISTWHTILSIWSPCQSRHYSHAVWVYHWSEFQCYWNDFDSIVISCCMVG